MVELETHKQYDKLYTELLSYVYEKNGIKVLKHPYLYCIPYYDSPFLNIFLNEKYREKKNEIAYLYKQIREAYTNKKYDNSYILMLSKFVFLYERPYRAEALQKMLNLCSYPFSSNIVKIIRMVWIDSEYIWENLQLWRDIIHDILIPEDFMHTDEICVLNELFKDQEKITIYRGNMYPGISWTTDKTIAEKYSERYGGDTIKVENVERKDIFAYVNSDRRKEIILYAER